MPQDLRALGTLEKIAGKEFLDQNTKKEFMNEILLCYSTIFEGAAMKYLSRPSLAKRGIYDKIYTTWKSDTGAQFASLAARYICPQVWQYVCELSDTARDDQAQLAREAEESQKKKQKTDMVAIAEEAGDAAAA